MKQLMANNDFGCFSETHADDGRIKAANFEQETYRHWWSHNPGTHASGGILLCIRKQFLRNFNPVEDSVWIEIVKGRVGCLRLDGPKGSLEI